MNEQNLARVLNNCFVFWLDPKLFEVPFIVDALNGVDHLFFLWEWASVCGEPLGTWQTIACIPKDNLNGVRSTLISNQLGAKAYGG